MKKKLDKYKRHNFNGYSYLDWFRGSSLLHTNGDPKKINEWRKSLNINITEEEIMTACSPQQIFYDQGVFVYIHPKKKWSKRGYYTKKQIEDSLNELINEIKRDKTRILVEIDLTKTKSQLLAELAVRIDEYQPLIPTVPKKRTLITKKELTCDPWLVWSIYTLDGLSLAGITRKLFDDKNITSDNEHYAAVRRAYQRSCDFLKRMPASMTKRLPSRKK